MNAFALEVPESFVAMIAERVAALLGVREPASDSSPWLDTDGAAKYLCAEPRRIYELKSRHEIPHYKDGTRLLFRRDDLDTYLQGERV